MLRTILLCTLLGLFSHPSRANPSPAAVPTMSDAETLAALELQAAVREAYRLYFEGLGLPLPELETNVQVRFLPGSAKQIASANIDTRLSAASSPPDQIIREARQAVARRLAELGYEVAGQETASDDEATMTAPAPRATLLIDVVTPDEPQGLADRLRLGPILVVTAMALTALLCAVISILMLRRLWRTVRTPARRHAERPQPELAQKTPAVDAPDITLEPSLAASDTSALTAASSPRESARETSQQGVPFAPKEPEVLPPLPNARVLGMKNAHQSALPPLPPAFEAFERLPFDEAVRAFSAFDQEMRTAIFERLGIKASVRHRIEQALSQIQAT